MHDSGSSKDRVGLSVAVAAVEQAVNQAPRPLSERSYSGTFVVRTSPALHARVALEATEPRVSMNQWIDQKLSGRQLSGGLGPFGFD
ncbi:MAG TPA: type II toxin-antitoxin system HicB family antitoxin [Mycobacterium sp.]|nr:type II toxin-antitoxin system HicB family antitoxin [Mycobacterium sp.]